MGLFIRSELKINVTFEAVFPFLARITKRNEDHGNALIIFKTGHGGGTCSDQIIYFEYGAQKTRATTGVFDVETTQVTGVFSYLVEDFAYSNQVRRTGMEKEFYQHILNKQQVSGAVPSNKEIAGWALRVIRMLYPEQSKRLYSYVHQLEAEFMKLESELCELLDVIRGKHCEDNEQIAKKFFNDLPELYRLLNTDIEAAFAGDPAAKSEFEVVRAYPGFYAISFYRLAHTLHQLGVPLIPRILTEYAHSKTGIDIHPAAQISDHFFIDHGTGVVIGETCVIGRHVKIYQGVTLGALSVTKNPANAQRHPTVEDHVVIYAGATILGGHTVIGEGSIIGGNVWLTKSIPPYSKVYHTHEVSVLKEKIKD